MGANDLTLGGEMQTEHDYFEYLYNLAMITIAFVGFAGLYIGFKTADKTTKFDALITRNHFVLSFAVVGACLLPQLLSVTLPWLPSRLHLQGKYWGAASGIAAITPILFSLSYRRIRNRVTGNKMPTGTCVLLFLYFFGAAPLVFNTYENSAALFVFGMTLQQTINVLTFLYALTYVLAVPEVGKQKGAQ